MLAQIRDTLHNPVLVLGEIRDTHNQAAEKLFSHPNRSLRSDNTRNVTIRIITSIASLLTACEPSFFNVQMKGY